MFASEKNTKIVATVNGQGQSPKCRHVLDSKWFVFINFWLAVGQFCADGRTDTQTRGQLCSHNSAFHPSGVCKWGPASAEKAKAGMVHSVRGWTRGVQVKLWDLLRTRVVSGCIRRVFTTMRYTNPRLRTLCDRRPGNKGQAIIQ